MSIKVPFYSFAALFLCPLLEMFSIPIEVVDWSIRFLFSSLESEIRSRSALHPSLPTYPEEKKQ